MKETENYVLDHIKEFETMEYGNLESTKDCYYRAMFNDKWSYSDVEANTKEGWIRTIAWNYDSENPPVKRIDRTFMPTIPDPYIIFKDGKPEIAYIKLFGDVIIFKTEPTTNGELIKKVNNEA